LFEGKLKRPCAARLHSLADQLKLAPTLVDGDATANQYCEAVRKAEAQKASLAAEENDRQLRLAILESEVNMARGRRMAVGDLAFDPKVGIGGLDMLADICD
jgi:hypothetical protein